MSVLLDEQSFNRMIKRMSYEIIERNKGIDNIVLVGIKTRGEYIAKRIANFINLIEGSNVPCCALDIKNYRDDIPNRKKNDLVLDIEITGKKVVLVDDVLFKGRTVRAALDALVDCGRPSLVQLLVIVDRGHRELPIRADYVGKNIPTSLTEDVEVKVKEVDGVDEVNVNRR